MYSLFIPENLRHPCMHACMHTYIHTHTHTHTRTHTHIHTYIHTHTHTHTYTHAHTYIHTYIHTYTHTHCVCVDKMRFSGVFSTERSSNPIAFTVSPRDNTLIAEPACHGIWCWRAYLKFLQVQFWLKSNLNNSLRRPTCVSVRTSSLTRWICIGNNTGNVL
jgi:hypothetical protein